MTNTQSLRLSRISKIFLRLAFILIASASASAQVWTVLAGESKGDVTDPSLADAAQLAYRYDKQQDFLWFRVSLYGAPNEQAFGVNLIFDTGDDEKTKANWWGANNSFRFDKLVTAWVTHGNNGYEGTIGVGDVAGANVKRFNNLLQNNLHIRVEGDSIVIGVKRTDITDKVKMNVMAAVGSNQRWTDDIPNTGSAMIDLAAERPKSGLREIDVSRNNLEFPASYKTLPDDQLPVITKKGQGQQPLILVPGMYSGATTFDGFIARNQSRYTFYVVTPPGINGTPARPIPRPGSSFGELTWTRRLERDILALIRRKKLTKPVLIAERQPGSVAAIELAIAHPDQIGAVILVGTNLVQFFPSPTDLTRRSPIAFEERAASVDEGWGAKWFKYVTPETWNSGDMLSQWFSSNLARGQRAWHEFEAAPLPVKIRYLCEFWASDVTRDLDKLHVPVMALIPVFDGKFLADPANAFVKMAFISSWEPLIAKHPMLEVVKIFDARLLVLEDQPQIADDAIAAFAEKIRKQQKGSR